MTTIRIPTPLRPYSGGNEYITVTGQTVGEMLDGLARQFPDLRPHLFNEGHQQQARLHAPEEHGRRDQRLARQIDPRLPMY